MQRIKNIKKETGLSRHKASVIFVFILFIFIVVCIYTCSRAEAKGQIEIGMSYNSNTKREKNNFLAKIQEKKEDLEIEINTNFYKEQEDKNIESLMIDSEIQVNYYANKNTFYYALAGYNRNIEQGVIDKTLIDIGMGYKDYEYKYPFRTQVGLSSQSIYYDQLDLERNMFLTMGGDTIYSYKILDFKNEVDFLMNLKKFQNTDVEIKNIAAIIVNLTDGDDLFLSLSLNYSYFNHPVESYPKEIKIWMLRAGFTF